MFARPEGWLLEIEQLVGQASNRRIALLIDADNISASKIAFMLAELSKYGTVNIRRAYGDWANKRLKGWKEKSTILPSGQSSNSANQPARMLPISHLCLVATDLNQAMLDGAAQRVKSANVEFRGDLSMATEVAADALARSFGSGPLEESMSAHVISAEASL